MQPDLSCFFNPESIAIIGVSRNSTKAGYGILKNVLWTFPNTEKIFPINPRAKEIMGLKVYHSLTEIPGNIDLAILFVTPRTIPSLLQDCYLKGVKGIIIESAGFAEIGKEGKTIQEEIRCLGKQFNIRIWGGNCMGTVTDELITTFKPITADMRRKGVVSIVGQSGYFSGAVILQLFTERYTGIRKAASVGNRIDIDECDLLQNFLEDETTKVAAFYLEGLKRPRKFLKLAKKFTRTRPLICLLGGQSEVGRSAVLSHTSSTAHGSPQLLSDLLKQSKILQATEFGEFSNIVEAFAKLSLPNGKRLAIVTITGAGGVIGADIVAKYNITIPELSISTTHKLQNLFPDWMPPKNPVDSWPAFEIHGLDEALRQIIPILFESDEIDMILLMVAAMQVAITFDPTVVRDMKKYNKPLVTYIVGDDAIKSQWTSQIRSEGGVVFDDINTAIEILDLMASYSLTKGL
ncbi:MAG: CoA-binding protein [Candidatus Hodarchaeales archaeon]|jgi:acetyltransferase